MTLETTIQPGPPPTQHKPIASGSAASWCHVAGPPVSVVSLVPLRPSSLPGAGFLEHDVSSKGSPFLVTRRVSPERETYEVEPR